MDKYSFIHPRRKSHLFEKYCRSILVLPYQNGASLRQES